jgi:hypothetical protein
MNERRRDPATDRTRLVGAAYATPAPLAARAALYEPAAPSGSRWTDVLHEVEARVTATIERDGAFTARSDAGMLLCRAR